MVLAEQFITRVTADFAKALVYEGNAPGHVGDADNRVVVQGVLQAQAVAGLAQVLPSNAQRQGQHRRADQQREQPGVEQQAGQVAGVGTQDAPQQDQDQRLAEEDGGKDRGHQLSDQGE
jgi:hypothetical protein